MEGPFKHATAEFFTTSSNMKQCFYERDIVCILHMSDMIYILAVVSHNFTHQQLEEETQKEKTPN